MHIHIIYRILHRMGELIPVNMYKILEGLGRQDAPPSSSCGGLGPFGPSWGPFGHYCGPLAPSLRIKTYLYTNIVTGEITKILLINLYINL